MCFGKPSGGCSVCLNFKCKIKACIRDTVCHVLCLSGCRDAILPGPVLAQLKTTKIEFSFFLSFFYVIVIDISHVLSVIQFSSCTVL